MKHSKQTRFLRKGLLIILIFLSIIVSIFNNLHHMENNLVEYSLVSIFVFLVGLGGFIKKIVVVYIEGMYRKHRTNQKTYERYKEFETYEKKYLVLNTYIDTVCLSLDIALFISIIFMGLSVLNIFDILEGVIVLSAFFLKSFNSPLLINIGEIVINIFLILGIYGISLGIETVIMKLANKWIPKLKYILGNL